ncbi:Esd, partial [Symbiodinium sp. CCMP2456]
MLRHMMAPPELLEIGSHCCYGGTVYRFEHISPVLGYCSMKLSAFVPSAPPTKFPGVIWLSGLTCTDESFAQRGAGLAMAQRLKLILIMPDTSPRGEGVPDEDTFDVGVGASYYVNATTDKYKKHYKMLDYLTQELPSALGAKLPLLPEKLGIMGHSMGGHGALVAALKNPGMYRSVSAFAPISNPSEAPWGQKAFNLYFGEDKAAWADNDAVELLRRYRGPPMRLLVDQGTSDMFLSEQLKPGLLKAVCDEKGIPLTLRMQSEYDHSYYFISSFIQDHLKFHASFLNGVLRWCPDPGTSLAPSVYSVDPTLTEEPNGPETLNADEATDAALKESSESTLADAGETSPEDAEEAREEVEEAATNALQTVQIIDGSPKEIDSLAAVSLPDETALQLVKVKVAPPQAGEVRVRQVAAVPSRVDLVAEKEKPYPRILGLESSAVVEDVGEGVVEFQPGDHVIPCYHAHCGECGGCKAAESNFCDSVHHATSRGVMVADSRPRFSYGSTEVYHFKGTSAFSEYSVVHAHSLIKVRKDAPLAYLGLLGGGVAAALGAVWNVGRVQRGASAVVFGAQAEGLAVIAALVKAGAGKIVAVDPYSSRLDMAQKWGATSLLNPYSLPEGVSIKDEILKLIGSTADFAFDCRGDLELAPSVLEVVKEWGKCVTVGTPHGPDVLLRSAWPPPGGLNSVTFGGWRSKPQIPLLVDLYMAGELQVDDYITREESFENINDVFDNFDDAAGVRTVLRF